MWGYTGGIRAEWIKEEVTKIHRPLYDYEYTPKPNSKYTQTSSENTYYVVDSNVNAFKNGIEYSKKGGQAILCASLNGALELREKALEHYTPKGGWKLQLPWSAKEKNVQRQIERIENHKEEKEEKTKKLTFL